MKHHHSYCLRIVSGASLSIVILLGLAGCAGLDQGFTSAAPPQISSAGNTPTGMKAGCTGNNLGTEFAYLPVSPGIAGFRVDAFSGDLTQLSGSPFTLEGIGLVSADMKFTPRTQAAYAVDSSSSPTIIIFCIDPSSGKLRRSTELSTDFVAPRLIMNANGRLLFVRSGVFGSETTAFAIAEDGSLAPASTQTLGPAWGSVSIDPAGRLLYAEGFDGSDQVKIFGYLIAGDGKLTPVPGSPISVRPVMFSAGRGNTGVTLQVAPGGDFLFVADFVSSRIWVYSIHGDGSLTQVPGSPFDSGITGGAVAVDPAGKLLFNSARGQLSVLQIGPDGALNTVPGSPYQLFSARDCCQYPTMVANPEGRFLLLSDPDYDQLLVFSIDRNTGTISEVAAQSFASDIGGVVMTH